MPVPPLPVVNEFTAPYLRDPAAAVSKSKEQALFADIEALEQEIPCQLYL